MEMQVMVFKLPEEMNKELAKVGAAEERTKAWIIRKSIKKFLEERKKNATTN